MTTCSDRAITILRNPSHPTFGRPPAAIGGHDVELDSSELALAEGPGNSQRTALTSDTRGIGKTVFLSEFETAAKQPGRIMSHARVGSEIVSELTDITTPRAFGAIDSAPMGKGRRLTGLSIAGIGGFKTEVSTSQPGSSRNLLSQLQDLSVLFMPQESGILLTPDGVQSTNPAQLSEVVRAVQGLSRDDVEIAFIAAGLPSGIEGLLRLEDATFLRRTERVSLGRLGLETTKDIIRRIAEFGECAMTEDVVELASEPSHDYLHLIQTIGPIAWAKARLAHSDTITAQHILDAAAEFIRRIGLQVHVLSLRKVPFRQIVFLKAMARLSPGGKPVAASVIAETIGRKLSGILQLRHDLIYRELIMSASTGYAEFTLPYFADYLNTLVE